MNIEEKSLKEKHEHEKQLYGHISDTMTMDSFAGPWFWIDILRVYTSSCEVVHLQYLHVTRYSS